MERPVMEDGEEKNRSRRADGRLAGCGRISLKRREIAENCLNALSFTSSHAVVRDKKCTHAGMVSQSKIGVDGGYSEGSQVQML